MTTNARKILVALDGSDHALDTVRYLCRVVPPHGVELVLFCVLNREPEYFLDSIDPSPARLESSAASRWANQQKDSIRNFMETARRLLTDCGFPSQAISVTIQERRVGIARDIIREAQEGYDAVVAGRQGMNPITRLVIGSIASKLVQSLTFVPLWLIGNTRPNKKMLVAMDASDGAMRAVEHVGSMLDGADLDLTLFRVIRSTKPNLTEQEGKPLEAAGRDPSEPSVDEESQSYEVFRKASRLLEQAGIRQDQITTKVVSGVATRSGSIIAQAATGGYGTIVLGRRGHSKVGEFSMGRVTNKVIQLAGKMAVWVVN